MNESRIYVKTEYDEFIFYLNYLRANRSICIVNNELMDVCEVFFDIEYLCNCEGICGKNKKKISVCVDRDTRTSELLEHERWALESDISWLITDNFPSKKLVDFIDGEYVTNDFFEHIDAIAVPRICNEICSYAEECAAGFFELTEQENNNYKACGHV